VRVCIVFVTIDINVVPLLYYRQFRCTWIISRQSIVWIAKRFPNPSKIQARMEKRTHKVRNQQKCRRLIRAHCISSWQTEQWVDTNTHSS